MYGTIARMQLKPGALAAFQELSNSLDDLIPGFVSQVVLQTDANPQEFYLVALFTDKEAYVANAQSEAQHARYEQYRALLSADPEWHDGEIVFAADTVSHGL